MLATHVNNESSETQFSTQCSSHTTVLDIEIVKEDTHRSKIALSQEVPNLA